MGRVGMGGHGRSRDSSSVRSSVCGTNDSGYPDTSGDHGSCYELADTRHGLPGTLKHIETRQVRQGSQWGTDHG